MLRPTREAMARHPITRPAARFFFPEAAWGYFFIAPFVAIAAVFLFFPIVYSFYLSLRETTLYSNWFDQFRGMEFVGLNNYRDLLRDPVFWWSLVATGIYALIFIPLSIAAALALALALGTKLPGYKAL